MRIAILGAGSMGQIIGAYLTKAGYPVEHIDANKAQVEALQKNGSKIVHVKDPDKDFTIPVKAYLPEEMSGIYDFVVLVTKQTSNHIVLPNLLKYLNKDSIVCAFQNGIPEPAVAEVIGAERTIGGAMLFPATWLSPGVSSLTTPYEKFKSAAFDIGEIGKPVTPRLKKIKEILDNVGHTSVMDNHMETKWTKLLVNSCGSGLSAALNCTFGDVVDNPKSLVAEACIAKECLEVCHAEGYKMITTLGLDFETLYWTNKEEMRRSMDKLHTLYLNSVGKASMLQDLEKKQPTEIDYINGHVVKYGKKHGIPTPFCDKVVELVKEAEAKKGVNDMSYVSRFDALLEPYKDMF